MRRGGKRGTFPGETWRPDLDCTERKGTLRAAEPPRRLSMAREFREHRDPVDHARQRELLADDLVEDNVDDSDSDDESVEELGGGLPATTEENAEEPAVAPPTGSRTAKKLEERGQPAVGEMRDVQAREK